RSLPLSPYTTLFRSPLETLAAVNGGERQALALRRLAGPLAQGQQMIQGSAAILLKAGEIVQHPLHPVDPVFGDIMGQRQIAQVADRKSTRLNSSHVK